MTHGKLALAERGKSLVVDTSAAVAVIRGEPGADQVAGYLEGALVRLMPAAIRVELGMVIEARLGPAGQDVVDRFLREARIDIVSTDMSRLSAPSAPGAGTAGAGTRQR